MKAVIWSERALADFDAQIVYLADQDANAALLVANRVEEAILKLQKRSIGRPGRVHGTYEKSIEKTSLIIAYAIGADDNSLSILRIVHTSRLWRPDEWPE